MKYKLGDMGLPLLEVVTINCATTGKQSKHFKVHEGYLKAFISLGNYWKAKNGNLVFERDLNFKTLLEILKYRSSKKTTPILETLVCFAEHYNLTLTIEE